jgi:hypothetical protein
VSSVEYSKRTPPHSIGGGGPGLFQGDSLGVIRKGLAVWFLESNEGQRFDDEIDPKIASGCLFRFGAFGPSLHPAVTVTIEYPSPRETETTCRAGSMGLSSHGE